MARAITFLSDYGRDDEFVGVCHAVIARIAPEARVIDIGHGIVPHDVRHGATVLAGALPYAPPGVHLAVVDPGVGSPRKAVAVRVAEADRVLVGPDNGLLSLAIERFGGALEAVEISRSPVRFEPVSATFHGRDLFAPVAAHLALGTELRALGEPVDPGVLVAIERRPPAIEPSTRLVATVGHVDSFGNLTLIAGGASAAGAGLRLGRPIVVEANGERRDAAYVRAFAEVAEGELLLYVDAADSLALAVNRGSAAERLAVGAGDEVELCPA